MIRRFVAWVRSWFSGWIANEEESRYYDAADQWLDERERFARDQRELRRSSRGGRGTGSR
jgi:hypothetical protein